MDDCTAVGAWHQGITCLEGTLPGQLVNKPCRTGDHECDVVLAHVISLKVQIFQAAAELLVLLGRDGVSFQRVSQEKSRFVAREHRISLILAVSDSGPVQELPVGRAIRHAANLLIGSNIYREAIQLVSSKLNEGASAPSV